MSSSEYSHSDSEDASQYSLPSSQCSEGMGDTEEYDQVEIRKSIARFIAMDGHPFEIVKGKGFIELISHCRPTTEEDTHMIDPNSKPQSPNSVAETGDSKDAERERFKKSLARFVVIDGHPIEIVLGRGFAQLMSFCFPQFKPPTATGLSRICYQLYLDEKFKLQNFMALNCQSVCLAIDSWSSPQGLTYMGITAHFIDKDWKLHQKVLSFAPNPLTAGDEIGEEIETCLKEWGIKKVLTITMDKSISNDDAFVYLKERLIGGRRGILGCKYLQMKCIAHIINSVVVQALEKARLSVNRLRNLVRYMKIDSRGQRALMRCANIERISYADRPSIDVDRMWSSTYVMLCGVEKFERAFNRFKRHEPDLKLVIKDGLPSSEDWSIVRKLTGILRQVHNIMSRILESSSVTSSNYWVDISDLYAMFLKWENGDDVELQAIAKEMRLKLDGFFGDFEKVNKIVYIAAVLDPRCKFEVLEYAFGEIYGEEKGGVLSKSVKEAMVELFDEYKTMKIQSFSGSKKAFNRDPSEEHYNIFMASYKKQRLETWDEKLELEMYLNEPTEDDECNFDILEWWKCKSGKFPILSHMARDILAIPKLAVRPDHIFNTDKPMLDESRGYLDHKDLKAFVCAQDWLRNSPYRVDIVKEYKEDEKLKEEVRAELELESD